jgi:hypothetical protein
MALIFTIATARTTMRTIQQHTALIRTATILMVCAGLFAARANAADTVITADAAVADVNVFCNGIRLGDEIVVVDTRMACGSCDPDSLRTSLRVENYEVCDEAGHRRWRTSDLESFLSFDSTVPTVFYVHGNQMTSGDAKSQGVALYRKLAHYSGGEGRVRFVIFSWPSAKVGRLLRDVRVKAQRTGPAGCQLAWLLDQMPAETPVSLIGFSFGARIITAGLHVLGGGSVCNGMGLDERVHPDRAPMNAVLIASAVHAHWLGKGQYHGLAMTKVNRMFLLNNCDDLALNYYHLSTSDRSRPQALGICGPTRIDSEYAAKIRKRDVSRYAGSRHDLFLYLCAPGAIGQVWDYAVSAPGTAVTEPQPAN